MWMESSVFHPADLSEKVFTFLLTGNTSFTKLMSQETDLNLTAMTVCLRYHSVLTRAQSLFSLATPSNDNDLLLYKTAPGAYRLHMGGSHLDINYLEENRNDWNSICWTWDSGFGQTALWLNGRRSARKVLRRGYTVAGRPAIVLGQEQDTYGGGFEPKQSFVGDITDVHFWSEVISPCEIRFYMEGNNYAPGNLLNWASLDYDNRGSVFVNQNDFDKMTCF